MGSGYLASAIGFDGSKIIHEAYRPISVTMTAIRPYVKPLNAPAPAMLMITVAR